MHVAHITRKKNSEEVGQPNLPFEVKLIVAEYTTAQKSSVTHEREITLKMLVITGFFSTSAKGTFGLYLPLVMFTATQQT